MFVEDAHEFIAIDSIFGRGDLCDVVEDIVKSAVKEGTGKNLREKID